jgi:hypothetical protein
MAGTDGAFTLTAVAPGVHRLQATHGSKASRVLDVTVEADKQADEVRFELDEVERNVLTVRVIGVDGQPKPNAFVFVEMKTLTADANGEARGAFPQGLRDGAPIIVFAESAWAFGELRRSGDEDDPQSVTIRFVPPGALRIRSKTISGAPQILSARAGDLSWMLERIGTFLSIEPDSPLVVHGLPPGMYEVRLGADSAPVSITAGNTAAVDLR